MQIVLRFYIIEYGFVCISQLPMVELYYNCFINEASKHSPFEVSYVFSPSTLANRLLPYTGAPAPIAKCLSKLTSVRDVIVREHSLNTVWLLSLPDQCLFLLWVTLFSYPLKVYIFIPKRANT